VSTTTPRLPGVRRHPNGKSEQVRVHPFPPEAGFVTIEEANRYSLKLRELKAQGILVAPPRATMRPYTLSEATRDWYRHLDANGGTRGRALTPGGRREYRRAGKPWVGIPASETAPAPVDQRGVLFADIPVEYLRRPAVDQYLTRRKATAPKQAKAERQALLQILNLARENEYPVDHGLFALRPILAPTVRKGIALDLPQLAYLAAHAPAHQRNWFLLGGTLGARIMSLLNATDDWLNLDAGTLTIPAAFHKSGNVAGDLILDLLAEEVGLFRQQLLVRAAGTSLLFPRRYGTRWTHSNFHRQVWTKARDRAARDWQREHGEGPTPFDGLRPHDLRHTAATVLCERIADDGLVALRLGHADGGKLIRERYRHVDRNRLRVELDRIDAAGGLGLA
jgi:integrase